MDRQFKKTILISAIFIKHNEGSFEIRSEFNFWLRFISFKIRHLATKSVKKCASEKPLKVFENFWSECTLLQDFTRKSKMKVFTYIFLSFLNHVKLYQSSQPLQCLQSLTALILFKVWPVELQKFVSVYCANNCIRSSICCYLNNFPFHSQ